MGRRRRDILYATVQVEHLISATTRRVTRQATSATARFGGEDAGKGGHSGLFGIRCSGAHLPIPKSPTQWIGRCWDLDGEVELMRMG